ncbi:S46 family peptidase [Niabella sp. W65]|nr:S46 family peptidase [Niabella sp. W65]MCH7369590.1 S46 family peptidase [Niabella sp. W65]
METPGSPVINANGELIGLAFDGNYEALSHKLAFDKDLNRTINVDIRYVLWCIDKLEALLISLKN